MAEDNPVRKARPDWRNRATVAMREFLTVPLSIVAGWLAFGAIAIVVDRMRAGWAQAVRGALDSIVPVQTAGTLLQSIVTGLITLNSIVFFVLIMAVQHQSSAYTPVVLDQFLRRRTNQLFFGLLVGEAVYCVLVLTLVPPTQALLSGSLALVGVAGTLMLLLAFVYTTVDQMRPSASTWMIQRLALRARASQQPWLARCRSERHLRDVASSPIPSGQGGYIVRIDADRLARAIGKVTGPVEIEFHVAIGDHIVLDQNIAHVHGADPAERALLVEATLDSLMVGRMPDIDRDAGHAIDHLGNMAWSAASSSDPDGAQAAIRALHSLLAHWTHAGHDPPDKAENPLPIVYNDRVIDKVLDALTSVIAAAGVSKQHQTCGNALQVMSDVMLTLAPEDRDIAVDRLQRVLPTSTQQVFTRDMELAFDSMLRSLDIAGLADDAKRVAEIRAYLEDQHRLAAPQPDYPNQ